MKKLSFPILFTLVAFVVLGFSVRTQPAQKEYRALIAETSGDPYEIAVFENTLGDVSFSREQMGVFNMSIVTPTFAITNTFVMVTPYNDGIATPEMFEASPEDPYTIQFLHYQERTSLANAAKLMLSDGYNGSTAWYVSITVYP